MIKYYFIIFFIPYLTLLSCYCQELKIEAVYFDESQTPFKIERKYYNSHDTSYIYLRITDEAVVSIQTKETLNKDTVIKRENYCWNYSKTMTNLEKYADNDSLTFNFLNKDRVKISFFKNKAYIGDTIIRKINQFEFLNYLDTYKRNNVSLVLNNKIQIFTDSFKIQETVKSYYLNNNIVKEEIFDNTGQLYSSNIYSYSDSTMICNDYRDGKLFKYDSLIWNSDTTQVKWFMRRELDYENKFCINQNIITTYTNDTICYLQKEYLCCPNMLRLLILDGILYGDPLFGFDLYKSEISKFIKITYKNNSVKENKFTFDSNNRIIKQEMLYNDKLILTVSYEYK